MVFSFRFRKNFVWLFQTGAQVFETSGDQIIKSTYLETVQDFRNFLEHFPYACHPFLVIVDTWAQKFTHGVVDASSFLERRRRMNHKLKSTFNDYPWWVGRMHTSNTFHGVAFVDQEQIQTWILPLVEGRFIVEGLVSYALEQGAQEKHPTLQISLSRCGTLRQIFCDASQTLLARFFQIQNIKDPRTLIQAEVTSTLSYLERTYPVLSQEIILQVVRSEDQAGLFPEVGSHHLISPSPPEEVFLEKLLQKQHILALPFLPRLYRPQWRRYRIRQNLLRIGRVGLVACTFTLGFLGFLFWASVKDHRSLQIHLNVLKHSEKRDQEKGRYQKEKELVRMIQDYKNLEEIPVHILPNLQTLALGFENQWVVEKLKWYRMDSTGSFINQDRFSVHLHLVQTDALAEQARVSLEALKTFLQEAWPHAHIQEKKGPLTLGIEHRLLKSDRLKDRKESSNENTGDHTKALLEIDSILPHHLQQDQNLSSKNIQKEHEKGFGGPLP